MNIYRFVHLNVHSHYSVMDGCADIEELVDAAIKDKMPGMALTDDVIMSGVMEFFDYVNLINKARVENKKTLFKPIIGCQLPVYAFAGCEEKGSKTKKFHVIALAKNMKGYQNLMKLASIWESGPGSRLVDDKSLKKYREGLIVLYGGYGSEAAECIKRGDMKELEQVIQWYKETFG